MSDWGREKGFEFEFFDGLVLPFLGLYLSHFDLSFRGIEYQNRMCDGPLESLAFFFRTRRPDVSLPWREAGQPDQSFRSSLTLQYDASDRKTGGLIKCKLLTSQESSKCSQAWGFVRYVLSSFLDDTVVLML